MGQESKSPNWENVVSQLTGFAGGTREDVGKVGSMADSGGGLGSGWLKADIKRKGLYWLTDNEQTTDDKYKPERTIVFYDDAGSNGYVDYFYEVTLTTTWSSSGGSDFSDGGKAGAYDWGYGEALEQLVNQHTVAHFNGDRRYPHNEAVDPKSSVDLNTFIATAKSFDEVRQFFADYQKPLEGWDRDLGGDDAAWQGSAADTFHALINGLHHGYKDYADLLTPTGTTVAAEFGTYTSTSVVGDNIIRGGNAIHNAAKALHTAWTTWTGKYGWLPTHHLDNWIDKVAIYLNARNLSKIRQSTAARSRYVKFGDFSIYYDEGSGIGDLRTAEAWQRLSQKAYTDWVANLAGLDTAANTAAVTLNNALADVGEANSSFVFNAGMQDLKTKFTEEQAKKEKEKAEQDAAEEKKKAEQEKEDLEKKLGGGGGDPPPGLGSNDTDGGLGDQKPPPGLNPNGIGNPKDGLGNTNLGTPPPGLGLNDTGNTVKNPDGSITTRNPDGSSTTTFPDGHKETTPPGTLPPPLFPNNPGGPLSPGAGGTPLKTVKGPDGSTTSYNRDGSTTTTHKDGTTTTVGRDGTVTTVNPDGSTTVLHKDGSETVSYPDGTKTTIRPDGSSVTQYKDGSTSERAADGTLTTTDAEGHKTVTHPASGETVHNPDGSTTTFNKDGSATTVHKDGTRTTVSPNGTVTTIDRDGTKTVSHLGKHTSTVEYADGSVAKVDKDGTVTTTYKDGTATKLGPDGTYTTTDPKGNKTTEHLNPLGGNADAVTKHNPDGSTTTRYPDGTVDQKLKDGGHKITYPDGRTVTTDADGRTLSVTGGSTGLGSNKTSSRLSDYDYYDYPDTKRYTSLLDGGGSGYGDSGSKQSGPPALNPNPLGGSMAPPGSGGAGSGGLLGERTRGAAMNEAATARQRSAQLAAEEAAAMRRPATTSGGMPMMPPMGGAAGGGQKTQSEERERATWVSEDEDVWGTDEGGVTGVIGR
ncbi:AAWKG family protein [Streptomyces palmae]|uniref:Centromere protein J C-terminal domain-containing protein n=1 Tax=Streptomyces palmae TaxID=1701085 RepID=A0A4Z0H9U3_9ACTN|nr:AAWKG family protein [Streptomyces palmae]TGB05603.1 hypothetical protein E4099_19225 [Streptomyces palmae]